MRDIGDRLDGGRCCRVGYRVVARQPAIGAISQREDDGDCFANADVGIGKRTGAARA